MKKNGRAVILIVDDQPINIFVLEHVLQSGERLLLTATNGKDALHIALTRQVDLIMLDVQMPEMDGFEVAQILKSNKRTKDIPIIFVTAVSKEQKFMLKGYEEGAIDYLYKPLDPEVVKAKVAVLLRMQLQRKELMEKNAVLQKNALLINNSADVIGIIDAATLKIEEINQAFTHILGYSKEEARNTSLSFFLTREAWALIQTLAKSTKEKLTFETRIYSKNRTIKWLHWKVVVKEGKWFVNARDITEIKEGEKIRNYLATVVKQSNDAIYIHDQDGQLISWNEGAEKIYGYTESEALHMKIWNIIPVHLQAEMAALIQQVAEGEKVRDLETIRITREGKLIDVLFSATVITGAGNGQQSVAITERDITEQKIADEAIRESKEQIETIFKNAPDAVIVVNNKGQIREWNPQAEALFGWRYEEVLGQSLAQTIIPERFQEEYTLHVPRFFDGGASTLLSKSLEVAVRRKDHSEFVAGLSIAPLLYKQQQYYIGFLSDITERKAAEEQIRQLNEDLERRVADKTLKLKLVNEDLEKRAAELQASNIELERFAFVASHDLQEPLRIVSSFLTLLEAETGGQLDEAAHSYIRFAVDGAERMKKMIQALLAYSRLDSDRQELSRVDCNALVQNVQFLLSQRIQETRAQLQVASLPTLCGVEGQLQQVFQNLIGNALKYHQGRTPHIEVGCQEKADHWLFFVRDNGIGIDPKYFEKIFIIFQRLHDTATYPGTGIGLAICKKIVEKHGGTIWVESTVGRGSTFYFTLPKLVA